MSDIGTLAHARPQHMEALELANRVRVARADVKRKIAAGQTEVAHVIVSCPWMLETMSLGELLTSQKRWGRSRAHKFLKSVGLRETKPLSTLTERQRVTLAALLSANRVS